MLLDVIQGLRVCWWIRKHSWVMSVFEMKADTTLISAFSSGTEPLVRELERADCYLQANPANGFAQRADSLGANTPQGFSVMESCAK